MAYYVVQIGIESGLPISQHDTKDAARAVAGVNRVMSSDTVHGGTLLTDVDNGRNYWLRDGVAKYDAQATLAPKQGGTLP